LCLSVEIQNNQSSGFFEQPFQVMPEDAHILEGRQNKQGHFLLKSKVTQNVRSFGAYKFLLVVLVTEIAMKLISYTSYTGFPCCIESTGFQNWFSRP